MIGRILFMALGGALLAGAAYASFSAYGRAPDRNLLPVGAVSQPGSAANRTGLSIRTGSGINRTRRFGVK